MSSPPVHDPEMGDSEPESSPPEHGAALPGLGSNNSDSAEAEASSGSSAQPEIPSVMHRIAQFEGRSSVQAPIPSHADEGGSDSSTTEEAPTPLSRESNQSSSGEAQDETPGPPILGTPTPEAPQPTPIPATPTTPSTQEMDPTYIARVGSNDTSDTFPSLQEAPTDEYMNAVARSAPTIPASDGSASTPGGQIFERNRAPTPDASDIAMKKSQDSGAAENDENGGGPLWDASRPPTVPAVAQREAWLEEAIQPPAIATDDVTESTRTSANNAFDVAMSRSADFQTPLTLESEAGGPLWEASKPTPVPAVLSNTIDLIQPPEIATDDATESTGTSANNAFDVAMSHSVDVHTPPSLESEKGGPLWEASKPAPVPAVLSNRESIIQRPEMATDDVTESTGTSANNAFDVAISRPADFDAPSSLAPERGGPLWEASKPALVPAILSKTPGTEKPPAFETSDVSASTATTKPNAFDVVLQKTEEVAPETNQDLEEDCGGRLWEASKPTYIPIVLTSQKKSPQACDASASTITANTNAFDVALSKSADHLPTELSKEEQENGGPMWEASKPSPPDPIPAVLTSPPLEDTTTPQAIQSPDEVTESTATGTNAFDKAISAPASIPKGDISQEGGRMWEASKPAPIPAILTPPPSLIPAPEPCDVTASTVTDAFDVAVSRDAGNESANAVNGEGGRLWEASRTPLVPVGASSLQANQSEETQSLESGDSTEPTMNGSTFEKFKTPTPNASVDGRSLETGDDTEPTVGGSTFERLRSPTPDAADAAVAKSEDFLSTENFDDEELLDVVTPQLIKEQTQSRATPYSESNNDGPTRMVNPEDDEDLHKFKTGHNIRQRRRMVQLLVIGGFVTLFGWFGNFLVADSCHFVAVPIEIGQYNSKFELHYGLWKYSPPESALTGYPYCNAYAGNHEDEAPVVASIFHLLSLAAGSFSLGVLWYFIVSGASSPNVWKAAIWVSILAAVFQLLTLVFFASNVCREKGCEFGFGSSFVFVVAFSWIVLALELRYQAPHLGLDDSTKIPEKDDDAKQGVELTATAHTSTSLQNSVTSGNYKPPIFDE